MIADLMAVKSKIKNKNQKDFIQNLYDLLDEFSPFLDQQSESQLDYLKSLSKIYLDKH